MSYTKQEWVAQTTVISAARLNHIEDGIGDVDSALTTETGRIDTMASEIAALETENEALKEALNDVIDILPQGTAGPGNPVNVADAANMTSREAIVTVSAKQGSGTPSASNVLPITGHTGVNVLQSNAQFVDFTLPDESDITFYHSDVTGYMTSQNYISFEGTSRSSGVGVEFFLPSTIIPANTPVYVSFYNGSVTGDMTFELIKNNPRHVVASGTLGESFVFESENEETINAIAFTISEGSAAEPVDFNISGTLMLTYGETAPTITEHEIDWSDDQDIGTVYGGTIDMNTGKLTITHAKVAITSANVGTGTPSTSTYGTRIGFNLSSVLGINLAESSGDILCNIGTGTSPDVINGNPSGWTVGACCIYKGSPYTYFRYIFPADITTAEAGLAHLVQYGCEFTYQLPEPVIRYVDPAQIRMLKGANGFITDGTMYLRYCKDISSVLN